MKDMMIGVDLAKAVFQFHGAYRTGEVQFRKTLTRKQFPAFMAQQEPSMVIFEACGSAHYWAREMEALGHEVKLIAPQYVRPFVKRQKNDAADAEAIVIAARQPEMRFVARKTVEQQCRAAVFRGRERLVHQRTADVNALRALLYEHGHVFPAGILHLDRMTALMEDEASDLPALIREECRDLLAQIAEKTARIIERTTKLKMLAAQSDRARRLQTMPGVGPLTAIAVEAFGPDMAEFKTGRAFCRLAGPCAQAAFIGRQGTLGTHDQGRPCRYPPPADHWGNVAPELAWAVHHYGRQLAGAHVGTQAQDAGRDRVGQQDGQAGLGDADEKRRLQGSGAGSRGMILMSNR